MALAGALVLALASGACGGELQEARVPGPDRGASAAPPDAGSLDAAKALAVEAPPCPKDVDDGLTFTDVPSYAEKIDRDGDFSARVHVGNTAKCTHAAVLTLGFTPPASTQTRVIERKAEVPPGGAVVEVSVKNADLQAANVVPGRYAITFAIGTGKGTKVNEFSGNAFKFGQDEVELASDFALPAAIGRAEELEVKLNFKNRGDTPSKVTALLVFTRPGETKGIEVYERNILAAPGLTETKMKVSMQKRLTLGVQPGSWLVTVTAFNAAGDRLDSYAGNILKIGRVATHLVARPQLPTRIKDSQNFGVDFAFLNAGDTDDRATASLSFTRSGEDTGVEISWKGLVVPPGRSSRSVVVSAAERRTRGVGPGSWMITATAFDGAGTRLETFAGRTILIDP